MVPISLFLLWLQAAQAAVNVLAHAYFASGEAYFGSGEASFASGEASFASGEADPASGEAYFASGEACFASGEACFAFGKACFAFVEAYFACAKAYLDLTHFSLLKKQVRIFSDSTLFVAPDASSGQTRGCNPLSRNWPTVYEPSAYPRQGVATPCLEISKAVAVSLGDSKGSTKSELRKFPLMRLRLPSSFILRTSSFSCLRYKIVQICVAHS